MKPITNLKTATFNGRNGQRVFYRNWRVENKPKGIIVIVHGLNSHSAYYENFALQLNENEYEVYAIDLPGRGRSDGERYYVADYKDIVADIDQLISIAASAHGKVPFFLFGHSAGGVFVSVYAVMHQSKLNGLISESFAFRVPAPGFAIATIKLLSYIIPHTKLVKINNEDFSRDALVVKRLNDDPLIANEKQPNKTMQQLFAASAYLKTHMPDLKLPLLILHGTADRATQSSGSQYFMDNVGSVDKKLNLYEGHYHDLLNDKYSGIVIRDIIDWLNARV